MAVNVPITINVLGLKALRDFIAAIHEIAGTTNDPNTETNLYAALDKLKRDAAK